MERRKKEKQLIPPQICLFKKRYKNYVGEVYTFSMLGFETFTLVLMEAKVRVVLCYEVNLVLFGLVNGVVGVQKFGEFPSPPA